ncbi:MAG: tyrosine-type recombinase/integrase [Brevundimonas sp.]|uniref:tyrosine-type recombinase/integrase n=1 Tax=Brevundimonas sp. TaxID=1871086 RepID=UPI0027374B1C|nr:tyrosine-type recombinase/integrase [Brevundimonas sp.]MDP3405034.1 tyrosine-type recombinase/integrase [Brevundimonas sp.]
MSSSHCFSDAAASYVQHGGEPRFLPRVVERFGPDPVETITPMAVREAALSLYPEASNATRNRQVITPARAVLYHAHEMGWRAPARIRLLKAPRARRVLPAGRRWTERFVERADADGLPHLSAALMFMQMTGARVTEAISLEGQNVDLIRRTALLVKTKTDTDSLRWLPDPLVERIRALDPRPGERVFRYTSRFSVNERMAAVCHRAGLPYKSSHIAGRHAFATNALNAGINVRVAMDAGGWKSSVIFLETYAHSVEAGRVVMDRLNTLAWQDQL